MSKTTVFVTGGTGLVGAHLLLQLAQEGFIVRALKRAGSNLDQVKSIFTYYEQPHLFENIVWVNGDITDITDLPEAIGEATEVYHTAALVSFNPKDQKKLYAVNIEGTANVVNACLDLGVKKLLYVSSTAAVGKNSKLDVQVESNEWLDEKYPSNYAVSKHFAEAEVWRGMAEGLNVAVVNPCIIIGPGDFSRSSGTIFKTIKNGLKFYTPGANAFVDVRDVVNALVMLAQTNSFGERYLLIGENLPYKNVFTKIANEFGVAAPTNLVPKSLMGLAWRVASVWAFFTNSAPAITKESTRSAMSVVQFSNAKFSQAFNYEFKKIDAAVSNTVAYDRWFNGK